MCRVIHGVVDMISNKTPEIAASTETGIQVQNSHAAGCLEPSRKTDLDMPRRVRPGLERPGSRVDSRLRLRRISEDEEHGVILLVAARDLWHGCTGRHPEAARVGRGGRARAGFGGVRGRVEG